MVRADAGPSRAIRGGVEGADSQRNVLHGTRSNLRRFRPSAPLCPCPTMQPLPGTPTHRNTSHVSVNVLRRPNGVFSAGALCLRPTIIICSGLCPVRPHPARHNLALLRNVDVDGSDRTAGSRLNRGIITLRAKKRGRTAGKRRKV